MAIEHEDLKLIKNLREHHPDGKSCAILGDCTIYGYSLSSFAKIMHFDKVDTFDINGNPTYKIDLNDPIPEHLCHQYDWVIDSGTLYCCFDISTVWKNITNMLKDKGYVLHTGNLTGFFGRGFFSLSPALFGDFYDANKFNVEFLGWKTRSVHNQPWTFFEPEKTFLTDATAVSLEFSEVGRDLVKMIPNDAMICCFASRENQQPFVKPIPKHFIKTDEH